MCSISLTRIFVSFRTASQHSLLLQAQSPRRRGLPPCSKVVRETVKDNLIRRKRLRWMATELFSSPTRVTAALRNSPLRARSQASLKSPEMATDNELNQVE